MTHKNEIEKLAETVASGIGEALGQTYQRRGVEWWLCTLGVPARKLTPEEVKWHTERNHKPFVPEGIEKSDPRWWDDP